MRCGRAFGWVMRCRMPGWSAHDPQPPCGCRGVQKQGPGRAFVASKGRDHPAATALWRAAADFGRKGRRRPLRRFRPDRSGQNPQRGPQARHRHGPTRHGHRWPCRRAGLPSSSCLAHRASSVAAVSHLASNSGGNSHRRRRRSLPVNVAAMVSDARGVMAETRQAAEMARFSAHSTKGDARMKTGAQSRPPAGFSVLRQSLTSPPAVPAPRAG